MGLESTGRKARFDLSDLGFLDADREPVFDILSRLASEACGAPLVLALVADDAVGSWRIKGAVGLTAQLEASLNLRTDGVLFEHVRDEQRLIDIGSGDDAKMYADLAKLHANACLCAPIHGPAGEPIGVFAIFDFMPRRWSRLEQTMAREFAGLASQRVMLRAALATLKLVARSDVDSLQIPVH